MGLKGRNALFLMSAILLIIAMAQPVIIGSTPIKEKRLHITLVIDRGVGSFEQTRSLALSSLYSLLGEEIELISFDDRVYRIAPLSNDGAILAELIQHLTSSSKPSIPTILGEKLAQNDTDMCVVVTSKKVVSEHFITVSSLADVEKVDEKLLELREKNVLQEHIPLFFYPLGGAMVLILFALSSMSKRQSVSVGMVLLVLGLMPPKTEAGVLDFQLLREAKAAYESGEYQKSERLYARYQNIHDSPEVRYNRANALYMNGKFERAAYWYKHVYTSDPRLLERTRYNLEKTELRIIENVKRENKEEKISDPDNQIDGGANRERPIKTKKITRLFIFE
jgi:tetratricopeptide (TPR) repeat protein